MRRAVAQVAIVILAIVGAASILDGAFPRDGFELDHGGYVASVRSSWWGLSSERHRIRLQHFDDWKRGRPYREPVDYGEWDWFIEGENGDWYPMDFVGPPDAAP